MLKYYDGTVFNVPVKTLVNTVNCLGVMGSGIALEFKLRFPKMYNDYEKRCREKEVRIGKPYIYKHSKDIWIMNFPTKNHWKYPSKIEWIEEGLKFFKENYKKWAIDSIAFPKLGTANGKLNWKEVKEIMEKYLINLDIDVYICLDEKKKAEGIEKEMVDNINSNASIDSLIKDVGINKRQAQIIINNLPITRFWHIHKLKGIGIVTYEKLFLYYYTRVIGNKTIKEYNEKNFHEQLSFIK